jgi:hypothetical protein
MNTYTELDRDFYENNSNTKTPMWHTSTLAQQSSLKMQWKTSKLKKNREILTGLCHPLYSGKQVRGKEGENTK